MDGLGRRPDPKKIEQLKEWPIPKDAAALNSFLCFVNYLRSHMRPEWVEWEGVLRPFRKKGVDFAGLWANDPKYEAAFLEIRLALSEDVVLVPVDYEAAANPA